MTHSVGSISQVEHLTFQNISKYSKKKKFVFSKNSKKFFSKNSEFSEMCRLLGFKGEGYS